MPVFGHCRQAACRSGSCRQSGRHGSVGLRWNGKTIPAQTQQRSSAGFAGLVTLRSRSASGPPKHRSSRCQRHHLRDLRNIDRSEDRETSHDLRAHTVSEGRPGTQAAHDALHL
jgi:hypothetical protein